MFEGSYREFVDRRAIVETVCEGDPRQRGYRVRSVSRSHRSGEHLGGYGFGGGDERAFPRSRESCQLNPVWGALLGKSSGVLGG